MSGKVGWPAAAALLSLCLAALPAAACETVRVGDSPLLRGEMVGCGVRLESRLAEGRRLSLLRAELASPWTVRAPLVAEAERLRFTQLVAEPEAPGSMQLSLKASAAERLPDAGADAPERGLAASATLRRPDGRMEWTGELLGADDGGQLGTGTRQRLRATLHSAGATRLDATARHERLEPTYRGWAAVLPPDRETLAHGLELRRDRWHLLLDRYGTRDNLAEAQDATTRWTGWNGALRYRPTAGGVRPQEATVTLRRDEQVHEIEAPRTTGSRRETAALHLAWRGPTSLRLAAVQQEAADGAANREVAATWQQGGETAGWSWHLSHQATALTGSAGETPEREARLHMQVGATPRHGAPVRLGLAGELRSTMPQDGEPRGDARLRLLASLRF